VAIRKIGVDQRAKHAHLLDAARFDAASHGGRTVTPGALERLDQQRVARLEVGVKAAVRQPGLLHHVGHADTGVAVAPDRPRGDFDDALVRVFLAAVGGAAHGGRAI